MKPTFAGHSVATLLLVFALGVWMFIEVRSVKRGPPTGSMFG
jgi:hypothetical protein